MYIFYCKFIKSNFDHVKTTGCCFSALSHRKFSGAPIISVKVLDRTGEGTAADIMNGIQWIYDDFKARKKTHGNRAKGIINMSLGAQIVHQVMEASMVETFLDLGTSNLMVPSHQPTP